MLEAAAQHRHVLQSAQDTSVNLGETLQRGFQQNQKPQRHIGWCGMRASAVDQRNRLRRVEWAPAPHAPWCDVLEEEAVRAELALPNVTAIPAATVDVAVIGAGIAGLSAAAAACAAGARTLVLEAEPVIGRGATGRNAGILSAGINMGLTDLPRESPDREMWPATTRELLSIVKLAEGHDALVRASRTGALSLAVSPSAARHLEREARARTALGLQAEMWDAARVERQTAGRLRIDNVVAALWLPDEGRIQPQTLLAQRAREARRAGAILAGNAPVVSFEPARGRGGVERWTLRLATGRSVEAAGLVVATGPTTAPTARIFALAFDADLPDTFPLFWDAAPYTYCDYRPGDGRLVTSGGRYGKAGGSPRDGNYHRRLADAARRWLPELEGAEPTYAWAVDLDVAADMAPRLRPLGAVAPGYAVEGLGALGVLPGTVLGRHAADAVVHALSQQ